METFESIFYGDNPTTLAGTLSSSFTSETICVDSVPNGKFKFVNGGNDSVSTLIFEAYPSTDKNSYR